MDTFELATAVIAGTALVLAPIDPQPIHDLNDPQPEPVLPKPAPEPAVVTNYDNYGSLWGRETVAQAEAGIAEERANGTAIDEWNATDRAGNPLRIVRMADPTFLDTISVIPA